MQHAALKILREFNDKQITIRDNNSAIIRINNTSLEQHSPEVVLAANQSYDTEISIPIFCFNTNISNTLKVTAITENGTSASVKTTVFINR